MDQKHDGTFIFGQLPDPTETTLNVTELSTASSRTDSDVRELERSTSEARHPLFSDTCKKIYNSTEDLRNHRNTNRHKKLEQQQSDLDYLRKLGEKDRVVGGHLEGHDVHSVFEGGPLSILIMNTLFGNLPGSMPRHDIFPDIGINVCSVETTTHISICGALKNSSQQLMLVHLSRREKRRTPTVHSQRRRRYLKYKSFKIKNPSIKSEGEAFDHWCLIEFDFRNKSWRFYDPLIGHDDRNDTDHVKYIEDLMHHISIAVYKNAELDAMICKTGKEGFKKRKPFLWKLGKLKLIKDFPTQSHDDHDCGVLVWLRAKFVTKRRTFTKFNLITGEEIDSKKERENLALDLYFIEERKAKIKVVS